MEYLTNLIYISIILLFGTLCSVLANKIGASQSFFLTLAGMFLGMFGLIQFPTETIITISLLTLIMIIFEGVARLRLREVISVSPVSLRLAGIFLALTLIFLTFATHTLFNMPLLLALLFASLMYGFDPVTSTAKQGKDVNEILELEAVYNSPLTTIIPLMLINILIGVSNTSVFSAVTAQIFPLLKQVLIGLGVGALCGVMLVLIMKEIDLGELSHLALLTAAVISYTGAEVIGGNGVLSVACFALIFGNSRTAHQVELRQFAQIFAHGLRIMVFILLGTILVVKTEYLLKGTLLFVIFIGIRFASVLLSGVRPGSMGKVIYLSTNISKGIDVAAIVLIIISSFSARIPGIGPVIDLSLLFILYSIVLASVVSVFSGYLLSEKNTGSLGS